jgi:ATP-dependent Clp protease ATP-binding subunit ClpC
VFNYFDRQSKHALAMAQAEAVALGHPAIGAEHLLLGILRAEGPACDALRSVGVDLERSRNALEAVSPRGPGNLLGHGGLELAPSASAAIEHADVLRHERHIALTPSLLLLSLVSDDDGIVRTVLDTLGASLDRVRAAASGDS